MVDAREIPAYTMLFVITGVMLMIGLYVLTQINTAVGTTGLLPAIFGNTSNSLGTLAQWLPIVAIVVAASIILYLIVHALGGQ